MYEKSAEVSPWKFYFGGGGDDEFWPGALGTREDAESRRCWC